MYPANGLRKQLHADTGKIVLLQPQAIVAVFALFVVEPVYSLVECREGGDRRKHYGAAKLLAMPIDAQIVHDGPQPCGEGRPAGGIELKEPFEAVITELLADFEKTLLDLVLFVLELSDGSHDERRIALDKCRPVGARVRRSEAMQQFARGWLVALVQGRLWHSWS